MCLILNGMMLLLSFVANSRVVGNIACGTPGLPFGGLVLPSTQINFKPGDVVTYSCKETDYLLGSFNRTCGPDSKWSGSVPVCLNPSKVDASWNITGENDPEFDSIQISDERDILFDRNHGSCSEISAYDEHNFWITFDSTRLLEGIRVVFPMHRVRFKFDVYSKTHVENKNCVKLGSSILRDGTGYQVTFNCSLKVYDGKTRVSLVLKAPRHRLSICEIYVFYGSDDGKCGTPDAPIHGQFQQKSNLNATAFNFYCDPGFELSGYNNTSCSPERLWIQETPLCVKNNMTFRSGPSTISTTLAVSNSTEFYSYRHFFFEFNLNYVYVCFGGLALLILIVIVVLKVRGVKRRNALSQQNDIAHSTSTSNLTYPSRCQVPFPLPRNDQMIQEIQMRHLESRRKSVTANHYSVALIQGENNQYLSLVGDPPIYENVDTAEPLYDDCFSGCSTDLYDDCLVIAQPLSRLPQPPQTSFAELATLQNLP